MLEQTSTIWIAAIVAVPTVLSTTLVPLWLKYLENQTRREERAEDTARLQAAADKAELVARKAEVATVLLAANTAAAESTAKDTSEKLAEVAKVTDVIHVLVNSQLTASKQAEFDAKERLLELLRMLPADPGVNSEIKKTEKSIVELSAVLADRKSAAKIVERRESS